VRPLLNLLFENHVSLTAMTLYRRVPNLEMCVWRRGRWLQGSLPVDWTGRDERYYRFATDLHRTGTAWFLPA